MKTAYRDPSMHTPGEHKTVQARILADAEAIGWIGLHGAHRSA
jgi:hypothetical protein